MGEMTALYRERRG